MLKSLNFKATQVSVLLQLVFLAAWQLATLPTADSAAGSAVSAEQAEYL